MERHDTAGLRPVLLALSKADEQTSNWICDALLYPQTYEELDERTSLLEELSTEPDVVAIATTVLERLRASNSRG